MKEKLTKEQKKAYKESPEYNYKKARNLEYVFNVLSWLALIAPDCILIGVNWNNWITTQTDAVSVSMGFILCLLVSVFLLYKKFATDFKFSGLTAVIGFWVAFAICILIQSVLQELTTILLYAAMGMTGSFCLNIGAKYNKTQKNKYAAMVGIEKKNSKLTDIKNAIYEASGVKKDKDNGYTPVD